MKKQVRLSKDLFENTQPIGRPKVITEEYVSALQELVRRTPHEFGYPFKRWTASWIRHHLAKELGIEVSDRHVNRLLQQMGLSKQSIQASLGQECSTLSPRSGQISIQDLDPSKAPEFNWPFK